MRPLRGGHCYFFLPEAPDGRFISLLPPLFPFPFFFLSVPPQRFSFARSVGRRSPFSFFFFLFFFFFGCPSVPRSPVSSPPALLFPVPLFPVSPFRSPSPPLSRLSFLVGAFKTASKRRGADARTHASPAPVPRRVAAPPAPPRACTQGGGRRVAEAAQRWAVGSGKGEMSTPFPPPLPRLPAMHIAFSRSPPPRFPGVRDPSPLLPPSPPLFDAFRACAIALPPCRFGVHCSFAAARVFACVSSSSSAGSISAQRP